MAGDEDEDELVGRQRTDLYPIGHALRRTYRADNHDSLGQDLTGLMLHLARVDDAPPPAAAPAATPVPRADVPPPPPPARGFWARLLGW
jgi:hypothetical protein